jgi:hypothetical protein
MTDYTCQVFGTMVGVSVTRAMKFSGNYTIEDAERILYKKLMGRYRRLYCSAVWGVQK